MESQLKYDSFHVIKKISGEISLDFTNQDISKNLSKIIKPKNIKKKNQKKNKIKESCPNVKRETKIEKKITKKNRKQFIPLPLIINDSENKEKISFSNLQINNNSFSYLKENNNINEYNEKNIFIKKDNINKNIYNLLRNNFECKFHQNNKYIAYCSICKKNICKDCLSIDSSHFEHKINYLEKAIPSEILIKYYKTLFIYSKYYLDRIREIIIEIYIDLSEFYEKEKNNIKKCLIENIQKQLIKNYKYFYIKNYYQLQYTKKIISVFCSFKEQQIINYQIIKNLCDIKINSVKIPDLFEQHIIIKARTMIEFMIYNSNNILKSSDSNHPSTIYNYKNIEKNKIPIENSFDINKYNPFNDLFSKNSGVIYEPNLKEAAINSGSKFKNDEYDKTIKINYKLSNIQDKEINLKEILSRLDKNIKNKINDDNINIIKEDKQSNEINYIQKSQDKNQIININSINYKGKEENIEKSIPNNVLNNYDAEIKKYIFTKLPTPYKEEVEYKNNIQYLYFDKATKKEIKCIYHGEFKKNTLVRHGRGLFMWEDGEFYLGYWANDKREGRGTNNYSNGDIYEGEYKNGKKEGKGIYKWSNGDIYNGNWRNDMKEGEGKYKCNNGDKYVGLFKMDKIEGNGLYIWANQNTYKGQFKNNEIEGKGILNYICSNANKEIKDIHKKISYQKIKDKQDLNEKNNKSNDDKKLIEIFTCDRNNPNKNNIKVENNDI